MPDFLTVLELQDFFAKKGFAVSQRWIYDHKWEIPGLIQIGGHYFWDQEVLISGLKDMAANSKKRHRPTEKLVGSKHGL